MDRYCAELAFREGEWISTWTQARLKDFYIEYLLYHQIGHHVDWCARNRSKANHRTVKEAADQYAFSKTTKRSITYKAESGPLE